MINNILLVALGGAFGSTARYLFGAFILSISKWQNFPLSTLTINVLGSFLIGVLHHVFMDYTKNVEMSIDIRLILITGFLGGFTTFSTFSLDALNLIKNGQIGAAASYVILSVILSILAIFFGYYLSSLVAS